MLWLHNFLDDFTNSHSLAKSFGFLREHFIGFLANPWVIPSLTVEYNTVLNKAVNFFPLEIFVDYRQRAWMEA